MIKKKAKRAGKTEKGKAKAKNGAKRTGVPRTKKAVDPAEEGYRQDRGIGSEKDGSSGDGGGAQGATSSD